MALTEKKRAFVQEYLVDLNATQAAIRAGYSPKTAKSQGQRLLTNVDIQKAIQKAMEARAVRTEITQDMVLEELASVAMGEAGDEQDSHLRFNNKIKSLELLGKHLGMFDGRLDISDHDHKPYDIPAKVVGRAFVDLVRDLRPNVAYVLEGGRGSLKSSIIAIICIWVIKNYPNLHAVITRQVGATLKDSVYAQIKWAIGILGLEDEFDCKVSPLEIIYRKTGQVIYFRGLDDETKLKSIKPPFGYIGFLWKEEKDQMKGPEQERSVNQSVLRGGDISFDFSSYNPPKSKDSWVNKELLIPNPNRIVSHSTYLEAPPQWLGTKFLEDAEHLKKVNPEAYEHEYLGVANGAGGNVFEFLEAREITDEEIGKLCQIYQGNDWGWYPDPYAFVRLNYDPNREEIIFIAENYVNKQKNSQTGQWIIDQGYCDYEVTCDSAEPKSVGDYRDMGIPAYGAKKGPGSMEYSMKWLAGKRIVIDPRRCPNAWREFSQYEYERDKAGNVISGFPDKDNHAIDATRYALERVWRRRWNHA